ncbi:MAG TPA: hypothetical protein VGE07_13255 [Herpetosiphonaceae bacterium]
MQRTIVTEARPARLTVRDLGLGAFAGLCGGLAMGIVSLLIAFAKGISIWTPLQEIAGVFSTRLSAGAAGFQFVPVLTGTVVHFALSALLGVLFAAVYRGVLDLPSTLGFPLVYGFIFGVLIWFISDQALNGGLISATDYTPEFVAQHLVFGSVTGLVFGMLRPARAYLPRD